MTTVAQVLRLAIHATPGARRTEAAGAHGGLLRVRLAAPPVDGKANDALVKFVADALHLPKSSVALKSGQASRRKVLEVTGTTTDAVARFAQAV